MERLGKRIAFLATGDEIVNGDILDTNAPYFARQLTDNSFVPGTRLIVSDDQKEMESAIRYLLQDHDALITIGGLSPTSDDRTRFAISDALEKPLQFDEASWDRIVEKLNSYNLAIPENNKQQCLFPENAEIYPNPNGTASACCINHDDKLVFMVPGPPNECREIFQKIHSATTDENRSSATYLSSLMDVTGGTRRQDCQNTRSTSRRQRLRYRLSCQSPLPGSKASIY